MVPCVWVLWRRVPCPHGRVESSPISSSWGWNTDDLSSSSKAPPPSTFCLVSNTIILEGTNSNHRKKLEDTYHWCFACPPKGRLQVVKRAGNHAGAFCSALYQRLSRVCWASLWTHAFEAGVTTIPRLSLPWVSLWKKFWRNLEKAEEWWIKETFMWVFK